MLVGIPKEIKEFEFRVGATPSMVRTLVDNGHEVLIERGAGAQIGYTDEMYVSFGGRMVDTPNEVYEAEMIIKVKEPQEKEFPLIRENQIIFCYLHLAPDPLQTKHLVESKAVCIAYETVTDSKGALPLLIPMSEIAGRIAIQQGANCLQMNNGGKGVLIGGVPGVSPAKVLIIGGGVVGTEAARMAMGLGGDVTVIDQDLSRLRLLDSMYAPVLKTRYSTRTNIEELVREADLVVGSVLVPGKKAPKLVTKEMIRTMSPGSVVLDVAIDQGGSFETSKPTTHGEPTYVIEGVVHYCVTNMPGSCPRTATVALTNSTLKYALEIANKGYRKALLENKGLLSGLNVCHGHVTNEGVAGDLGYAYVPPEEMLL